uniref:Uncharacterized protein n=1 Tax=Avena sativa TaxID=4498 RepID=A0ACD5ZJL2_AVESA
MSSNGDTDHGAAAGSSEGPFGGGGFVKAGDDACQAQYTWTTSSKSTLVPVTIKQVSNADRRQDGTTHIHGLELSTVRIVGRMLDRAQYDTQLRFTLDDGTGRIPVQRWYEGQWEANLLKDLRNGQYVIVHGHLRSSPYRVDGQLDPPAHLEDNGRVMDAYDIRDIGDHNFITFHFIQCIYVEKELTKSEAKAKEIEQQCAVLTQSTTEYDDFNRTAYYTIVGTLRDPMVRGMEHGISYKYIKRKTRLPDQLIESILSQLADHGDIFTTIDEHHYKWSME